MIRLFTADYRNGKGAYDIAVYDPPFDKWSIINFKVESKTHVCFTNFQNRRFVERLFGVPKFELIWYFKDGRWVSHNLPRLTHEHILIYGETKNQAYVGDYNTNRTPQKKGKGCVGKDKLGERIYYPRERKQMNSVIEIPRDVGKSMGVWGKPYLLAYMLLEWLSNPGDNIYDGFAGSGTFGVASKELSLNYEGYEIDPQTANAARERIQNYLKQEALVYT